jgi:hypothetical protein
VNRVVVAFSAITAGQEDMHTVAVERQVPELSPDEVVTLVTRLRMDTCSLARHIAAALNR